jgi:hypothetical protein
MKRPIHKGISKGHGVYNYCNDAIDTSKFSMSWEDVTCKRCLAKRIIRKFRRRSL